MDNDDPLSFELPNLDHLDLVELSYDSSSSMSSDCSPLNSPVMSPAYSPAPSTSSSLSTSPLPPAASLDLPSLTQKSRKHRSRCHTPHCTKKEHASVLRRNERERNRVKLVSDGFTNLRKHVPTNPSNKKLSKVETLRTAIEYIKHLQRTLNESKRLERQKRLVRQVGWLQEAYNLQSLAGNTLATQNAMNSILMELPDIAPYPSQSNGSYGFPVSELNLTSFYSPVS